MTEAGIAWTKSRLRKNRLGARVAGKRVVIEKKADRWLLTEDGVHAIGATLGYDAEALLRETAEQHYTHGRDWRAALAEAERIVVLRRLHPKVAP
jgi:hypothetical protein